MKKETRKIKKEMDKAWEAHQKENLQREMQVDMQVEKQTQAEISAFFGEDEDDVPDGKPDYGKRARRRKATAHAKKRLVRKAENAQKNLRKREESDKKNGFDLSNYSEGKKPEVAKADALQKRASKLQR